MAFRLCPWSEGVGQEVSIRRATGRGLVLDSGIFDEQGLVPEPIRLLGRGRLFATYASLVECVRGRAPADRTREANIRRSVKLLEPSSAIGLRAYQLYGVLRPLGEVGPGVADLYVAAAALEHRLVVVTHDRRDFDRIDKVEYLVRWAA